ncbi:MAG: putative rane protein [Fimbriimonadaceae bacterium]|jgi:putative membrane protein|nr:putative rane protein [Fimbriimonadaceae bacterium]
MKRLLLRWFLLALSVVGASLICESLDLGFVVKALHDKGHLGRDIFELFIGVAVLSLLNAIVKPILKFLTLPLTCVTLGLFSFVLNALILWLAASLNLGFTITGTGLNAFVAALVGSVLISCINAILSMFLSGDKDD